MHDGAIPGTGRDSLPARNWVWEDAKSKGHARHWILDDNIRGFWRRYKAKKLRCDSAIPLVCAEDFTDRYENVAITGFQYYMFAPDGDKIAPFFLNHHVYSALLIRNALPYRWRGRYNEDTDLCLQVLSGDWCTILLNAFLIWKMTSMTMKGGNTDQLYSGDGRLTMARSLERLWPGVVRTGRRFRRPQHIVYDAWGRFDNKLRLKPGIDLSKMGRNEYGLELVQVKEPRSPAVKELYESFALDKG